MFDIGWTEIAIVALIALLVIGPKDLPQAMRTVAGWINRIRGLAREFQSGIDEMVREAELDGIKKEFDAAAGTDLNAMVDNTIDPDGTMAKEFDIGSEYAPPDETSPAPRRKKKSPKAKTAKSKPPKSKTATKRTANTGAKKKRAPAGPSTKRPATKKQAPAKRTPVGKAPSGSRAGGKART